MTSAESLGVPMAVGVGREVWWRLTGRHDPVGTWDTDAAFLRRIGLDPDELLGPRPAARVDA